MAFSHDQVRPFLDDYRQRFPESEAVLLSTCNRTELYVAGSRLNDLPSTDELIDLLVDNKGVSGLKLGEDFFAHRDRQAIYHLFKVAASLDSMVLGEAQILSQVKHAYRMAVDTNQPMPLSHQVFQTAIRVARRVASETRIHANRVSIPSIAIGLFAKQIFERLDNKRMLIIGAGKMADETLTYLQQYGGQEFVVMNRTQSRAEELAARFNGILGRWDDLERELSLADIVVSTTGAAEPVITKERFDGVIKLRKQKPLFILDLAIPRDVEPAAEDHDALGWLREAG